MNNASFQNAYPVNMPLGIPGRIADCGFKNTLSPMCLENIPAAVGVMKPLNLDYKIMLPRNDTASSVFSADLITGNIVNMTVNGVAIAAVAFDTFGNTLDTMNQIALEISQIPTVASAVVGGVNNRTITIISNVGTATAVTVGTVTGGVSQATITTTASQSGTFFGIVQSIYNNMNTWIPYFGPNLTLSSGMAQPYFGGQVAPTLTQGRIYVVPETLITSNSPVYMRVAPNGLFTQNGAFRGDADGGTCVLIPATSAIWREGNPTVGEVAVIELNLP
jgi:hypothetical protein